ncbi:hypothetical protein AB4Y32_34640 [Paraburkholderia phymatum]|uniref:Uncharacterized protein n=1 Tax=Paraburkholderia phymatum TaxID=148447 RepID=A0ACC6UB45_9BURK
MTPLMVAALHGEDSIVAALLEKVHTSARSTTKVGMHHFGDRLCSG